MSEFEIQTEVWKNIPEFENKYQVSNLGRIRSLPWMRRSTIKIIHQNIDKRYGYHYVDLWKNGKAWRVYVHRLVLLAFVGPRPKQMECCHLDDAKSNNALINLKYGTRSENVKQSYFNNKNRGTPFKKGHKLGLRFGQGQIVYKNEEHWNCKFSNALIKKIKKHLLISKWGIQRRLSEQYGISQSYLSQIKNGVKRVSNTVR